MAIRINIPSLSRGTPHIIEIRRKIIAEIFQAFHRGIQAAKLKTESIEKLPNPLPQIPELSPRERETLVRLLSGDSQKQIAFRLGLSQHTVHEYAKSLHKKFGVSSRGEMIARCIGDPNALLNRLLSR